MIDLKRLYEAMPADLQRKVSCHDLKRTVDNYNGGTTPLREAARYALQRLETIRETHPSLSVDADIERVRLALDSENDALSGGDRERQPDNTNEH